MIELREYKAADLKECADLFLKVFTVDPWNDKWESRDSAKEYLTEFIANPLFKGFIASINGKIVAVCFGHKRSYWQGKEFQIDEMYVDTEMQGNGVGTKLLNYVKDILKEQGVENFVLITGKDIPAERFYQKNGFYRNDSIVLMNYKGNS